MGRGIGWLVWMCAGTRRRIVARNFRIILGGKLRKPELAPMVRENIVRTCMNFMAAAKMGVLTEKELDQAVCVVGGDVYENAGIGGNTGIACIPHAGNWEILSRIRTRFPKVKRYGAMYRRMSNPLLEKLVYDMRTAYGCEMFSKEDGLRAVLKLAKEGGLVGVLSDQFTHEGVYLPYFGKVTGTTPLPALIHKRSKGKLFSIYTRNTSLGHWDAVMNRTIDIPDGADNIYEVTLRVNEALEARQREDVLDGFWMHHRWKPTQNFAPPQPPEVTEILKREQLQPFRIIVSMPEVFDEALMLIPFVRALKAVRPDIQITAACPEEQKDFWEKQKEVSYTVTTDSVDKSLSAQLDADELYNDGPFDYVFLFDRGEEVYRSYKQLMPIYFSGFEDHPHAHERCFKSKCPRYRKGTPRHRLESYLDVLRRHGVAVDQPSFYESAASSSQRSENALFYAPFSTLGAADEWSIDSWKELLGLLKDKATPKLIALPQDRKRAKEWAQLLGTEYECVAPAEFDGLLKDGDTVIAADGLIPGLAAHWGARCIVLMASRLPACYRPLGSRHTMLNSHRSCHPCYRGTCDRETPCVSEITPNEVASYV